MPDWLDNERLQDISLAVLAGLGVLALLVFRFFTKMVTRVVALVVIAGLAFAVYAQRDELDDCAKTCDCRLFGQDVEVPACENGRFRGE